MNDSIPDTTPGLSYGITIPLLQLLSSHLHELLIAFWMLYTSSHATLTRPSSTANTDQKADGLTALESKSRPESLSPLDAVIFPILASIMLTGMYLLIKWLDDPELLNHVLRWCFSIVSMVSLTELLKNGFFVMYSFIFPLCYVRDGKLWFLRREKGGYEAKTMSATLVQSSPLPGWTSTPPISSAAINYLWALRQFGLRILRVRVHRRGNTVTSATMSLFSFLSVSVSSLVILVTSLSTKPPGWLINNILAHSFVYFYMSIISPGSFSTASLLLVLLFFYDIFMVFFTPMMVTVATTVEIPAKVLIPQPGTDRMVMLGLGDILLPGLVIAWALRFDLYLWYREQQQFKGSLMVRKPEYIPATGWWGERFWTSTLFSQTSVVKDDNCPDQVKGTLFAKPYFRASLIGYMLGLSLAGIMVQVYRQAQPALLYIVPFTMGAIVYTAIIRGQFKELWSYEEGKEDNKETEKQEAKRKKDDKVANGDTKKQIGDHGAVMTLKNDEGFKSWKQRLQNLWDTSILSSTRMEKMQSRQVKHDQKMPPTPLNNTGDTIFNFLFLQIELFPLQDSPAFPSPGEQRKETTQELSVDAVLKKGQPQQAQRFEEITIMTKTPEEKLAARKKESEGVYERELRELKKMS